MIESITFKGSYIVKFNGTVLPFSFTSPVVQIFQSANNIARQINDIAGYVCPVAMINGKLTRIGIFQPLYFGTEVYVFPEIKDLDIEYNIEIFARDYEFDFSVSVYELTLATEPEPEPESSLERYITKRIGFIPMSTWTPVDFAGIPFSAFIVTGVIVNEEPNINTNLYLRVLYQGDRFNDFQISDKDYALPEIPLTQDFSLEVNPTRDLTGISIGIKEVDLIAVVDG